MHNLSCKHIHTHVCIYIYVHVYIYICMYMYSIFKIDVVIYVHKYTYAYMHTSMRCLGSRASRASGLAAEGPQATSRPRFVAT